MKLQCCYGNFSYRAKRASRFENILRITEFVTHDINRQPRENEITEPILHTGISYYDKVTESRENGVKERIFHTKFSYYDKGRESIFRSGNYFN